MGGLADNLEEKKKKKKQFCDEREFSLKEEEEKKKKKKKKTITDHVSRSRDTIIPKILWMIVQGGGQLGQRSGTIFEAADWVGLFVVLKGLLNSFHGYL